MTETQQDEQPQADPENQEQSRPSCSRPGELLRKAREAKGLTQAEVAKQLNFLPVYIPSLEDEKFDVLHNKTFIKGYMRAYARFLKIDAEEVLRCFSEHHPELENQERIQLVEGIKPPKSSNLVFKVFTLLIILTLVAVIILWWQSRNLEPLPSLTNQDIQVDTLHGETITAPMGQAEEERTAEAAEQPNLEQEAPTPILDMRSEAEPRQLEALPEEEAEVAEAEQNQTPPPPPARSFTGDPAAITAEDSSLVALRFSDDCWTEVRDQQDRVLHANLNRAGDTLLLEGDAPFRMVFGQGRAVEIYYQGEALDFSHRIRPNGYASITVE